MKRLEGTMFPVCVIAGEQGSGKSSLMTSLWQEAVRQGIVCGGFLAPGFWNQNQRSGFDLQLVHSGRVLPFCRDAEVDGWVQLRRFFFSPGAVRQGAEEVRALFSQPVGLWLVDEIGPIELQGGLWHDLFDELLQKAAAPVVVSMRPALVDQICDHFSIWQWSTFDPASQPLSPAELLRFFLNGFQA